MNASDGITTKQAAALLGVTDRAALNILSMRKDVRRISRSVNQKGRGGMGALWHKGDVEQVKYGREHYTPPVKGETFVVGHPAMLKPWNLEGMRA